VEVPMTCLFIGVAVVAFVLAGLFGWYVQMLLENNLDEDA
jgi:hypothetical protein